jgi:hypothetical protein
MIRELSETTLTPPGAVADSRKEWWEVVGASVLVPFSYPKDRFKYNRAMNFSSQENRCEVGQSAYVSCKATPLDKPDGLGDSLCRATYLGAYS